MSRSTISDDFKEQLDDSPFGLLTSPTPVKEMNEESVLKESKEDKSRKNKSEITSANDVTDLAKDRMTVQMSRRIIERVKDAVYWTPGLTVAQFTEEALEYALGKLEKKNGKSFEKRKSELKPGRPVK